MVYNSILKKLDIQNIKTIIEVGARYGTESADLAKTYPDCTVHCFECNPNTLDKCSEICSKVENIIFNPVGVSQYGDDLPFFSYILDNDGCSSFYQRIDGAQSMEYKGKLKTTTLFKYISSNKLDVIDCLCMDTQGSELDIMKGAQELIKNVRYIILEQPNEIINLNYLPANTHSKYINAPSAQTIKDFLATNGFIEIHRQKENEIEYNVVYQNINLR